MTEYDLFVSCIPAIVESVYVCRRLDRAEYESRKRKAVGHCPVTVEGFMEKVLGIIDMLVLGEDLCQ